MCDNTSLGYNIYFNRKIKLDISQEKLGEKVFVSRDKISDWENGRSEPRASDLSRLAIVFEMSMDELYYGDKYTGVDPKLKNKLKKFKSLIGTGDMDIDIQLISTKNIETCIDLKRAHELTDTMKETEDISTPIELILLYQNIFLRGFSGISINILNLIITVMTSKKYKTVSSIINLEKIYNENVERLEEDRDPAGPFFRSLAMVIGIFDKGNEENLEQGIYLMDALCNEENVYAENFISYIEKRLEI